MTLHDDQGPVRVIGERRTNAQAIADLHRLGYLTDDHDVADLTYGLGRFWSIYRPARLVACDLDPTRVESGCSTDFTDTGFPDHAFDVTVLDPPYKLNGTSTGRGPSASDVDYGVTRYMPVADRMDQIRAGIAEAVRITRPGGLVLVKCQDQIVSNARVWQTDEFTTHAVGLHCTKIEQLHVTSYRPQPPGRRQLHAHQDYSTLLVFRTETTADRDARFAADAPTLLDLQFSDSDARRMALVPPDAPRRLPTWPCTTPTAGIGVPEWCADCGWPLEHHRHPKGAA